MYLTLLSKPRRSVVKREVTSVRPLESIVRDPTVLYIIRNEGSAGSDF